MREGPLWVAVPSAAEIGRHHVVPMIATGVLALR